MRPAADCADMVKLTPKLKIKRVTVENKRQENSESLDRISNLMSALVMRQIDFM